MTETPMNPAISSENLPSLRAPQLPDEPLFVVEAHERGLHINLKDLWTYRELLYFLVWRDVKIRYKQTLLGAAWAIIQPLMLMLIFTFFFGRLAGIKSGDVPYPIFAYGGLLPWIFFANAVTNSGNSLIGNTNLITKVYFPRVIIPVAAVVAGLVDLSIAFLLLFVLMVYYHVGLHMGMLLLPLLVFLATMLAVGVGMLMSALNVKYRDVRHALPFVIQIWMFASPVIYPVPERWRWLLALNPMTGVIQGFRSALFGKPFDWTTLGLTVVITLLVLVCATFAFNRMEKGFADVI